MLVSVQHYFITTWQHFKFMTSANSYSIDGFPPNLWINDWFPVNGNWISLYRQKVHRRRRRHRGMTQKFSPIQIHGETHGASLWENFSSQLRKSWFSFAQSAMVATRFLHQFAIFVISVFDYNFLNPAPSSRFPMLRLIDWWNPFGEG